MKRREGFPAEAGKIAAFRSFDTRRNFARDLIAATSLQ
jgi:hypothetical protein